MAANLTIIVASHNRASSLTRLLSHLPPTSGLSFSYEVKLALNGCTDNSKELLTPYVGDRRLEVLELQCPGKSSALNAALSVASGELVVFTDDDVIPSERWLEGMWVAHARNHKYLVFSGPIEPIYPRGTAEWLPHHPLAVPLYARYLPKRESGPISPTMLPFGPNFAVRGDLCRDLRFRTDLGPSLENGPLSYDDIDFLCEIRTIHSPFTPDGGFFFIREAGVLHDVRPEQVGYDWILERFFNNGRSVVVALGRIQPPPFVSLSAISRDAPWPSKLEQAACFNFFAGALFQSMVANEPVRVAHLRRNLREVLARMPATLLSRSTARFKEALFPE